MNLLKQAFLVILFCTGSAAITTAQIKIPYQAGPAWEWRKTESFNANIIATDKDDNIYIGGSINNYAFPPTVGNSFAFHITKYDRDGKLLWSKGYGSVNRSVAVCDIEIDDNGDLYLQGIYGGPLNIGTFILASTVSGHDAFTARISSNGIVQWVRAQSAPGENGLLAQLGLDNTGNTYTSGIYTGNLILGTIQLNSGLSGSLYIVKYDKNGHEVWAKNYDFFPYSVAYNPVTSADADGNNYVMAAYEDSIRFGNTVLYAPKEGYPHKRGSFLVKHDHDGNLVWVKNMDCPNPYSITNDITGNVYATGQFMDSIDLGAGVLKAALSYDGYIAGISKDGNTFLSHNITAGQVWGMEGGETVVTDNSGNVYVGGYTGDHGLITKQTGNNSWMIVDTLPRDAHNSSGNIRSMAMGKSGNIYTITNWTSHTMIMDSIVIGKLGMFPAGIANITAKERRLQLYPNPTTGSLNLKTNDPFSTINIYDISGKKVFTVNTISTKQAEIDIRHLTPGIYILHTNTKEGTVLFTKQ